MKYKILTAFLVLYCTNIFSQELNLKIRFLDTMLVPMTNTLVTLTETETRQKISNLTNNTGEAVFTINTGKVWQIGVKNINDYYMWQIEMPVFGKRTVSRTYTYSYSEYKISTTPPVDRKNLKFEIIDQQNIKITEPDFKHAFVKLMLLSKNGNPAEGIPVTLTSIKYLKMYKSKTDASGTAIFKVLPGEVYQADIEDVENMEYVAVRDDFYGTSEKEFLFEPSTFVEKMENNIITQELDIVNSGSSARHLAIITFTDKEGNLLANQTFQIKDQNGEKIYQATTNNQGIAKFMLPKGKKYFYTLKKLGDIEENILIVDITRAFGVGSSRKTVVIPTQSKILTTKIKFTEPSKIKDFAAFLGTKELKFTNIQTNQRNQTEYPVLCIQDPENTIGISKGFLITTGSVFNAIGPNTYTSLSTIQSFYTSENIPEVMKKEGQPAFDAAIVEFDIVSTTGKLIFDYVFGSEEYLEYKDYDDAFGIFVTGEGFDGKINYAEIPQTKANVSVININDEANNTFFIHNNIESSAMFQTWEYDGFSKKLSKTLAVKPNKVYHVKLIIFDRRDAIFDSGVFVGFRAK